MKLPFIKKLSALGGVFSRLNPAALIAKIKAKKQSDDDEDEDDGDLFGGLGDLDHLDAKAAENGDDDNADDASDDDDEPDVLDEVDGDDHDFADLDAEDAADDALDQTPAESAGDGGLIGETLDDLGDFDIGEAFEESEDDDEEAQKAKLKKLIVLAGGGVAAAVVLGGVAWWLLGGGEGEPSENEVAVVSVPGKPGDLVIALDDVPPFVDDTPIVPRQPDRVPGSTSDQHGAAPMEGSPGAPVVVGGDVQSELQRYGLDVQMEPGVGVVIPAVTRASFFGLTPVPAAEPLVLAPIEALVEPGEHGLLPRIGLDGVTPFEAYARPQPTEKSDDPKIAVIVTGLGMSRASTEAAIKGMPRDVVLALNVYARGLDFWVKRARQAGHEILLNMPSESSDFPFSDPGPNALKSLVPPAENLKQLEWILSRTTGYFGVLGIYGSKFLTVEEQVQGVMEVLKHRGVMYVDGGAQDSLGPRVAYSVGAKWATVEITLDSTPGKKALALQFREFEALAKKRAIAVARISADPGSLEGLVAWLRTLDEKGLKLVPLSSLANKQLIR